MLKPPGLREGQRQAMAGRLTPGSLRSRSMESAISAPVLPQETAAAASPARTASMADHMEVPLPLRITWLGLSSMLTTPSVARISQRPARPLRLEIRRSSSSPSPCTMKSSSGWRAAQSAMPATTATGPRSPPIASTEMTIRPSAGLPGAFCCRSFMPQRKAPAYAASSSSRSISSTRETTSRSS